LKSTGSVLPDEKRPVPSLTSIRLEIVAQPAATPPWWHRLRRPLQLALLVVAGLVIVHGLVGPQIGPRNLATVLTSIHWRGLLVVALLAAGNWFCTACPLVLARDAGRRLIAPRLAWPRRLRRKWVGIVLLVVVLFSYELFDLWELPAATAWLVIGYFGLAMAVDLAFKGASFCKHVCPIGQFNFIASTLSPVELEARDVSTCLSCRTSDCIKGRYAASAPASPGPVTTAPRRLEQRGCELGLFMPAKVGNLDCTFCFDCVKACPHGNIGLTLRLPGVEWLTAGRRSGIGRLVRRLDVAALALVFTFMALLNAFVMTAPAVSLQRWFADRSGVHAEALALAVLFLVALMAIPVALLAIGASTTRRFAGATGSLAEIATPYVYALVPLGFGVWLAHYGFHLLTGILTVVPVAQSAAIDLLGWAALGEPIWQWTGLRSGLVFPIQLGFVLLGAIVSGGLIRGTSARDHPGQPGRASLPWLALVGALAAAALWIFAQPMDMRGTSGIG
jgi:polyferredoxin